MFYGTKVLGLPLEFSATLIECRCGLNIGLSGIFLLFLKMIDDPLDIEPRDLDSDDIFLDTWVNCKFRRAISTRLFLLVSVVFESRDMATKFCSSGSGSGSGVFCYAMRLKVCFMSMRP